MSFAARIALCCAAVIFCAGAGRPDATASLLARMRAASGPVWRSHLVSTSHVTVDGDTETVASDSEGLRFVTRQCLGALCTGVYFDGERMYSVNINGTALPRASDSDAYWRGIRTVASLSFLDPDFGSQGGHIEGGGAATIDGTRYQVLIVANGDGVPMRVFVDPATALIHYIRDLDGDGSFEYRDYTHIATGLTLPTLVLLNGNLLEKYDERHISIDPFPEPQGVKVTFSGPPAPVATDPTKTVPVFPCTIGGTAARCLLDTGNAGLSISLELSERLGLDPIGSFSVKGLGEYATSVVRAGPLVVGNATFSAANYVVLNDISSYGYDAVLGADVLAATNIELDPGAHQLRFGARSPSDAIAIPMSFVDFLPVIDVKLGDFEAHLAVDTGDESNINLAYDYYQQHPTIFRPTAQRSVSGVGGSSVELIGEIPSVTIGSYAAGRQRIGTTESLRDTDQGHVGTAFLSNFKVIIDYASGTLDLIPGSRAAATPSPSASPSSSASPSPLPSPVA